MQRPEMLLVAKESLQPDPEQLPAHHRATWPMHICSVCPKERLSKHNFYNPQRNIKWWDCWEQLSFSDCQQREERLQMLPYTPSGPYPLLPLWSNVSSYALVPSRLHNMWQWTNSGGVRPFLGKPICATTALLQGLTLVLIWASTLREITFVLLEAQDKSRFRINLNLVTSSGPSLDKCWAIKLNCQAAILFRAQKSNP